MVVPAWKKLGLKLKQPTASSDSPSTTTATTATATATTNSTAAAAASSRPQAQAPLKRRLDNPPAQAAATKKPRRDEPKPKKSVTFNDTPSSKPAPAPAPAPAKKQKKQKNPPPPANITPALTYLRQWHSARSSWKFNKNHQTTLIKHAFDADALPAADVALFYAYIRDLKGFTRSRLRDAAAELRAEDSTRGAAGFAAGTADVAEKQLAYEAVLARVLHAQAGRHDEKEKKREFDEVKFREEEKGEEVVVKRAVRRMRAQLVIDELADDVDGNGGVGGDAAPTATVVTDLKKPEGNLKSDVTGKRRRKLRVNVDSDSSSSEESDSDTSSDESDSDDEDGKEVEKKKEMKKSSAAKDESDEDSSSSSSDDSSSHDDSSSDEE